MDLVSVLDTWRAALTVDFLRYFLAAAPFYLVYWKWRPAWLRGRRLQPSDPEPRQIASDFAYSLSTVLIFSAVGTTLVLAERAGLTRIYLDVGGRGWTYLVVSILTAVLVHDTYFYWTHRLLHWRPLFRLAHHVHHRSTSPTPWTAYAFHPVEAVIQAGVYVILVFTIPMHPLALVLYLVYMILRNVIGHLGYEIWPAGFARHWLTRWHLTPTHHDQHHRFGKGNYGFYFSFWDEGFGTGRSDYLEAYEAVTPARTGGRALVMAAAAGVAALALLLLGTAALASEGSSPEGRWITVDDRTGEPRSVVRVSLEDGELRGEIEALLRQPGEAPDPVCSQCRGTRQGQPIVGMRILSGCRPEGGRFTGGRILDPENGKEYSAAVWLEGPDRLRVRGYLGPLFRTQTWRRAP